MTPSTFLNLIADTKSRLRKIGVPNAPAGFEAQWIVENVSGLNRTQILISTTKPRASQLSKINKILKNRASGKPLAHLLKEAYFYGRRFEVSSKTLIPRPETETLLETVLSLLPGKSSMGAKPQIVDLGTGSGCIAICLTLERPDCRMTALEVSDSAIRIARKNLILHGLDKNIRLLKSRFFEVLNSKHFNQLDVIVSNPPYIKKSDLAKLPREVQREPRLALDGGNSGLEAIEIILQEAPLFLKPGGWLVMEIGKGQSIAIEKKYRNDARYTNLSFIKDLGGIQRVMRIQKHG